MLVLEVALEGQPTKRFESTQGSVVATLDDQNPLEEIRLETLLVTDIDFADISIVEIEENPELVIPTWYLAFELDDPVPFREGSVSNSLRSRVGTTTLGSFATSEHGHSERLELLQVDTEAKTVSLSFTSPLVGMNPSFCFGDLVPCAEADWTPVTGTITATISGHYYEGPIFPLP